VFFWWNIEWIEQLLEFETIPWDLDLRWTSITSLWKLKKVKWHLSLFNLSNIKDLGELQEAGYLDLRWTSITSLWNLKKVEWYLNLIWTSIEVQKEAYEKYINNKLIIKWEFFYDKELIKKLFKEDKNKKLILDLDWVDNRYWTNYSRIKDDSLKQEVKKIYEWYAKDTKKKTEEKIKNYYKYYLETNNLKDLNNLNKKQSIEFKKWLKEIEKEFLEVKRKIEIFWLEWDLLVSDKI